MIPFLVLVVSFALFYFLGLAGAGFFHGWQTPLRAALGVMFLLTASAHWGRRRADLVAMVPPRFPVPALLVTLTGVLEILGAIGLQFSRIAPYAAAGLFLLLIAVFPANVFAARHKMAIAGRPVPPLLPRIGLQILFWIALWFAM